jgi:hypothetical protein
MFQFAFLQRVDTFMACSRDDFGGGLLQWLAMELRHEKNANVDITNGS